jgi:hypothetical protein
MEDTREKKVFKRIQVVCLLLLSIPVVAWADLTGVWKADDNGTYYLRQAGNKLSWYGERSKNNPAWSNVYLGEIHGDTIKGQWVDVPKGRGMGRGKLKLKIGHNGNVLIAEHTTGGFGGSRWTRVGYNPLPQAVPLPAPIPAPLQVPALTEDCISFSTANARVRNVNGSWKIVDGSHWMFDFGPKMREARKALRTIKHYRLNNSCFVGRPGSSFTYMKRGNQAPVGAMAGEDCVSFNTANAKVKRIGGRWKIVDGNHMMFDFANKEGEARKSLALIKRYGFSNSCFVGRPNPSFVYLRQ